MSAGERVVHDGLRLTSYLGERDRDGAGRTVDQLLDRFAERGVAASALLRGVAGFGLHHALRSDRLLSLSEDLPVVAVAIDRRERIASLLDDVLAVQRRGLVTVERAWVSGAPGPFDREGQRKLTVLVGRQARVDGTYAYEVAVARLRAAGMAGATVLPAVDGTRGGVRRRARFLSANADVPAIIQSVGDAAAAERALVALDGLAVPRTATIERILVCKRDGVRLAEPPALPDVDPAGAAIGQKLVVYASESARHDGRPLYAALVDQLRAAGAAGATVLRGSWGFHGDHAPHGDRLLAVRRRVPVVTVIVDRPSRIGRWFAIADALTSETGLVTCEAVPGFSAAGSDAGHGGLALADLR
ncbi:hypothetical protein PAI11_09870 [Patulibacter medicamentivorans]|uniref:DUF190 domain-containing protein n=1 Tax=Patulibacter medicamentivorans TaxID=1097667 RepID=H0E2H4_9ACTN|nr:DUF190 domain-containing protein [Patulibacter medicamentivorans]EHN12128.1 hypothetical protein PAI11_09870 [Patulibacter medicamentivorans]